MIVYAYVRHPIYAGGMLIFVGLALLWPTSTFVLACVLGIGWFIIQEPHAIWPNAEGSRLYMSHERSNDVRVLDTETDRIVDVIPVGKKPIDVVFRP